MRVGKDQGDGQAVGGAEDTPLLTLLSLKA